MPKCLLFFILTFLDDHETSIHIFPAVISLCEDDDVEDPIERDLANWCIRMTQLGRHLKTPH